MAKRITIMLDDKIFTQCRKIQAEQIRNSSKNVSFSKVVNTILAKNIKQI